MTETRASYNALLHWMTTKRCNFSCEYCIVAQQGKDPLPEIKIDRSRLVNTLDSTGKIFHVIFSGGEPFFVSGIVDNMSAISRNHFITVNTNLFDRRKILHFSDHVDPKKVIRINASLHIKELEKRNAIDKFITHYHLLKSKGYNISASEVAYPPLLKEARNYRKRFVELGINFRFSLYNAMVGRKTVPYPYTKDQLDEFGIDNTNAILSFASPGKEILCNAGFNALVTMPDGSVKRCYQFCGPDDVSFGSLDSELKFDRTLFPCTSPYCSCPIHIIDVDLYKAACESASPAGKDDDAVSLSLRGFESQRYCIVEHSYKYANSCDTSDNNDAYGYIDIFKGARKHPRALLPVLKDDMFDIIHVVLSEENAEYVKRLRDSVGPNGRTKIILSYHSAGDKSNCFLNDIHRRKTDLTGADLAFSPYRDSAGLIKFLFKIPVYILPDPVDTRTISKLHDPSRKRDYIAFFINDDKPQERDFLHYLANRGYAVRIFTHGASGLRSESFRGTMLINLDDYNDEKLYRIFDDTRFAYMQDGFSSEEKYTIILAALLVPLIGNGLKEAVRKCFPSSLLYLKDDQARSQFAGELLSKDDMCREIGELAQRESDYYSYERAKTRLLDLLSVNVIGKGGRFPNESKMSRDGGFDS